MKRLVVLVLLMVGAAAGAQPVPPAGLRKVSHDSTLAGSGTVLDVLKLAPCVTPGQTWVWNGSAYACGSVGGSGSVTNVSTLAPLQGGPITTTGTVSLINCSANQIYKENSGGTAWACVPNAGITDSGTAVSISEPLTVGGFNGTFQSNAFTGIQHDVPLNSTATIFSWTGASVATMSGFTGGATGRLLIIINASSNILTLTNLDAASSTADQLSNLGAVSIGVAPGSVVGYLDDGTHWVQWLNANTQVDPAITFKATTTGTTFSGNNTSMNVSIATNGRDSHYRAIVTTPNTGTCGTSPTLSKTTDAGGTVTIGTSSSGNCTINFDTTYTNAPACMIRFHDATTNAAASYSTTATTLAITGAADSKTFDYFCFGNI